MDPTAPKPEKIRFRRDEIVRLGDLPSAGEGVTPVPPPRRSRALAITGAALGLLLLLCIALPAGVFLFGIPHAAGDRLLLEAELGIQRLTGLDVDATMGDPILSIDPSRFLALQVDDLRVRDSGAGANIIEAGTIRFGVRFVPLLSGQLQLGSAGVEDARIDLGAFPMPRGGNWAAALTGPDGLIEPGLVVQAAFGAIHRMFDALDAGSTRRIAFSNVEILLPPGLGQGQLNVESATLEREPAGFVLSALAEWHGRRVAIAGSASRDAAGPAASIAFDATASFPAAMFERTPEGNGQLAITRFGGSLDVRLTGREILPGTGTLRMETKLTDALVGFANGETMTGNGRVAASFRPEDRKIEIEKAELEVGRSRFSGHGAVGPAPKSGDEGPHYRYELVSDGSTLAPDGSTEPDLTVLARVGGSFDPRTLKLTANEIGLRTASGQANGTAIISFAAGLAPGVELALSVPEMPVSQAKQIWPWFAAQGAKNWANERLFGGSLRDSRLALSVKPGRIGSGIPLGPEEISGYFEVRGTRFDVAGQIPPVRDGVGSISFQGTNADIRIASGTVFLPTGRTVAANNGTFNIRRGELPPVIGSLDINVAGSADAVAELASYKPIDAMRHLSLKPEDLTGEVSGNIKARIPLQANVDMSHLGWEVKLSYQDLTIAKPFEGQTLTDAEGTIEVVPTVAVLKANGRLNGMRASLDIAEPLGKSDAERRREVTLVMDGKAREAMMPGLGSMLDGPVKVALTGDGAERRLSADLANATVSVPWVGWSKGPGIPAKLDLDYHTEDGETHLSRISLAGKSFWSGVRSGSSARSRRWAR